MNELIPTKQSNEGEILVIGRDLHEFLNVGTNYRDWIKRMIGYGFSEGIDYVVVTEKVDAQKRARTYEQQNHHIKIDMAKEISMLQRNEKGKQARQYFIEVERRWNSPEMIVQRAMEIQQRKVLELEQTLEKQKPLVDFAEACMTSEKSLLVRELAKLASKQGIKTGEKRLWQKLREWGLVFKGRNEPYQEYVERGYFEISQGVKETSKGSLTWTTMRVKPKGQAYIINKLKEEAK
ncbi:phage antirepressor KilAC domain-containing protein [Virgibacillus pantothenticus]|uniref:Antirepressor n=1 Tax=Virgibacillus pantothenticus TaxID=1473 RepID=A0A0L0QME9_VIRPA|nr:phage antirepressor KilAC domain-containing protein [Virgibacillus pantothenticus]KNE19684.1 hypothetical protein AFK71_14640 [Virgibacillus pantothenticus]MED3735883.1 antA/AntB antirepressor family protein [Virgibacillus pantothenticus]QTY14786.1 antA/AntB antirepressor family protein [Virgibacillus pantothenticus]SIT15102.1 anti-repressor protein [Virgibacillus pantothenticus]